MVYPLVNFMANVPPRFGDLSTRLQPQHVLQTLSLPQPDTFLRQSKPAIPQYLPRVGLPATSPTEAATLPVDPQSPRGQAIQWKETGNEYRKQRQFTPANAAYRQAIQLDPTYTDAYFNLAQLKLIEGHVPEGIQALEALLQVDPKDHDARVVLGEFYERVGNTLGAKKAYMTVMQSRPDFDPARRGLSYLLYLDQARLFPEIGQQLFTLRYQEIVNNARELLKQFFTLHHPNPILEQLSQRIPFVFEDTQAKDVTANVAEFDHTRQVMRIQPRMLFSTPNVVAAYLAHELIHAVDGDGLSSIQEEQTAYQLLAKFWLIYQGADNDPNLDRSLALYQQGKVNLDQEVQRVYSIQQPGIPLTSPGHGEPSNAPQVQAYQQAEILIPSIQQQRLQALLQTHLS